MAEESVMEGIKVALSDWRRNGAALAAVVLSFGVASLVGSPIAYYAAALVAFCIWMAWFVVTGVEFIRIAYA